MDRRERLDSVSDALLAILSGWQSEIYTALPGIIEEFDATKVTCSVQPAIQAQITNPETGAQSWVSLPLLVDCPVFFPSGGGCTLTFPVKKGDECLVVFANRCIDAWWQSGDIQNQAVFRMHDLSDGFAFVGVRSQPRKITVDQTAAQLRTDDGEAYVSVDPNSHDIVAQTSGNVEATGAAITLNGPVTVNGSLTVTDAITGQSTVADANGTMDNMRTIYDSHDHPGDSGGTTGAPNQQM